MPRQAAKNTVQFAGNQAAKSNMVITQGNRASGSDSGMVATDEDVLLPAGSLSVAVTATCVVTGELGNNWPPGKSNALV